MGTCLEDCSAVNPAAPRLLAGACLLLAVGTTLAPVAHAQGPAVAQPQAAVLPFRVEPPLRSYVAIRRLESENERHNKEAWLVARTELREDGSFHYEVLEEGGSEFIRRKVLREALEKERIVHREGRARRSQFTSDNYQFTPQPDADGLVRVGLVPRRKDDMLMKGTLVAAADGDILRVEGDLVKRPSFWTKSVHLVRHYGRIDGTHVPVGLDMVAQVRLAGTSTLRVTYEYLAINGRPVGDRPASLTRAAAALRQAAPR
jgi:hypothetical protein